MSSWRCRPVNEKSRRRRLRRSYGSFRGALLPMFSNPANMGCPVQSPNCSRDSHREMGSCVADACASGSIISQIPLCL